MSWAYSRSLSSGSFGYGEVGYRLAFKRPLGKKPLEELTLFAPRKAERRGTVPYRIKAAREEYKKLKPTLAAREREERRRKRQSGMRERVEAETETREKISHLEERGSDDDERRMEQEEALWWRRGEKEVPLVRQEEPEDPEGPQKTESPKVPQVLEKAEAPKCPLRIEVPVESLDPINEEKCDTRDFHED